MIKVRRVSVNTIGYKTEEIAPGWNFWSNRREKLIVTDKTVTKDYPSCVKKKKKKPTRVIDF